MQGWRRRRRLLADCALLAGLGLVILGASNFVLDPTVRANEAGGAPGFAKHARKPISLASGMGEGQEGCKATRAGMEIVADSRGYVCSRASKSASTGCCPSYSSRYSCVSCNVWSQCCGIYEQCVSCCLAPEHAAVRSSLERHIALARYAVDNAFELCRAACRSSSKSVVHENAYKHERHHCFGKAAPSVDPGLHAGVFDFAKPIVGRT